MLDTLEFQQRGLTGNRLVGSNDEESLACSLYKGMIFVPGGTKDGVGKLSKTFRYLEKVVGPAGSRCTHRSRPP